MMITPTTRSCCEAIGSDEAPHAIRIDHVPLIVSRPCERQATAPHPPDGHEGSKRKSRTPPRSSVAGEELQRRARPRPPRDNPHPHSPAPRSVHGDHARLVPTPAHSAALPARHHAKSAAPGEVPALRDHRTGAAPRPGRARRATSSLLGERQTGVSRGSGPLRTSARGALCEISAADLAGFNAGGVVPLRR